MININLNLAIAVFIILYVLGQVLEIGGLYFSARYADKKKVNLSKSFFVFALLGEFLLKVTSFLFYLLVGMIMATIIFKTKG